MIYAKLVVPSDTEVTNRALSELICTTFVRMINRLAFIAEQKASERWMRGEVLETVVHPPMSDTSPMAESRRV
jgi:hypothetical protein